MVFVECLFGGHRRNKTLDIVQRRRHKVHKISIFVLRSLAEGSHFTTDNCFSKKSRGPSIRRAGYLHITHKTKRISRECPEDFS